MVTWRVRVLDRLDVEMLVCGLDGDWLSVVVKGLFVALCLWHNFGF